MNVLLAKGKSNSIYTVPHCPDLVQKVASSRFHVRSYCIQTQKRIHRLCAKALLDLPEPIHLIRLPALKDPNTPSYIMERIDISCPLYSESIAFEPLLTKELVRVWKAFWAAGFAAWDFDLYLQSDGKVVLLDFDRFGFRMETDSLPPPPFFENSCFPPHFREMLI
jgi:hypothetical protein